MFMFGCDGSARGWLENPRRWVGVSEMRALTALIRSAHSIMIDGPVPTRSEVKARVMSTQVLSCGSLRIAVMTAGLWLTFLSLSTPLAAQATNPSVKNDKPRPGEFRWVNRLPEKRWVPGVRLSRASFLLRGNNVGNLPPGACLSTSRAEVRSPGKRSWIAEITSGELTPATPSRTSIAGSSNSKENGHVVQSGVESCDGRRDFT